MVQSSQPGLLANVHKANLGVQTGVQLARFRGPISGLNGAESTVSVKVNGPDARRKAFGSKSSTR